MSSQAALVTGATGLLGREVVKAFEKAGWNVTGTGFSRASGDTLKVDLTKQAEIDAALDKAKYVVLCSSSMRSHPAPLAQRAIHFARVCSQQTSIADMCATDPLL